MDTGHQAHDARWRLARQYTGPRGRRRSSGNWLTVGRARSVLTALNWASGPTTISMLADHRASCYTSMPVLNSAAGTQLYQNTTLSDSCGYTVLLYCTVYYQCIPRRGLHSSTAGSQLTILALKICPFILSWRLMCIH